MLGEVLTFIRDNRAQFDTVLVRYSGAGCQRVRVPSKESEPLPQRHFSGARAWLSHGKMRLVTEGLHGMRHSDEWIKE